MPLTRNTPKARPIRRLSLRKFPGWRRSRHIPSQWRPRLHPPSVLTCLATRAIVPGDSAKGTIAGHNREAPPAHGTTWAIVPSAIVPRHYRVAQSLAFTSPRYLFGDSALRDSARGTIAGHPHSPET
ncbi:hypothetical protein L6452_22808 [Arctium lappa]|uniref:Uncharacterized protein n=1 Tax=Arctium lappa TaxID=4217 RepID=A0ACB9B0W7_ARCLA|nr:hypothetical protein L6452_22808 [Arctium lappa]